jgi:hypothetical protein
MKNLILCMQSPVYIHPRRQLTRELFSVSAIIGNFPCSSKYQKRSKKRVNYMLNRMLLSAQFNAVISLRLLPNYATLNAMIPHKNRRRRLWAALIRIRFPVKLENNRFLRDLRVVRC